MDNVIYQNAEIEQKRKNEFLERQAEAEYRMQLQEQEKKREHEAKLVEAAEREEHIKGVLEQNIRREQARTNRIEQARYEKELKLQEAEERRQHELALHKEEGNVNRLQKRDTVERIMRANEYKKQQILNKIEKDGERCEELRLQKMELLKTRRNNRDEAGRNKEFMQKKFEILQRQGEIDSKALQEFGITQDRFFQLQNSCQQSKMSLSMGVSQAPPSQSKNNRRNDSKHHMSISTTSRQDVISNDNNQQTHCQNFLNSDDGASKEVKKRYSSIQRFEKPKFNKPQPMDQLHDFGSVSPSNEAVSPRPHTNQQATRFMNLREQKKQPKLDFMKTQPSSQSRGGKRNKRQADNGQFYATARPDWTQRGANHQKKESQQQIIKKRDALNMELMGLLEQETAAETIREQQLRATQDETERRRLDKIFGLERARASERIIATSDKHDNILRQEMMKLGLTF